MDVMTVITMAALGASIRFDGGRAEKHGPATAPSEQAR